MRPAALHHASLLIPLPLANPPQVSNSTVPSTITGPPGARHGATAAYVPPPRAGAPARPPALSCPGLLRCVGNKAGRCARPPRCFHAPSWVQFNRQPGCLRCAPCKHACSVRRRIAPWHDTGLAAAELPCACAPTPPTNAAPALAVPPARSLAAPHGAGDHQRLICQAGITGLAGAGAAARARSAHLRTHPYGRLRRLRAGKRRQGVGRCRVTGRCRHHGAGQPRPQRDGGRRVGGAGLRPPLPLLAAPAAAPRPPPPEPRRPANGRTLFGGVLLLCGKAGGQAAARQAASTCAQVRTLS